MSDQQPKGATKCVICGRDLTAEMRHLGLTVCHRHKRVRR